MNDLQNVHLKVVICFKSDVIGLDIGRRDDYAVASDVFEQNQDQFRMAGRPKTCPA